MIYIGIDPGNLGAIAVLDKAALLPIQVFDMPLKKDSGIDALEIYRLLYPYRKEKSFSIIERSNPSPAGGSYGKGIATFMIGYGNVLAVLKILELPFDEVHPLTWKKEYNLNKKAGIIESEKERKLKSIKLAHQLFPKIKLYTERGRALDGRADALLLADYCRRKHDN